MSVVEIKSLKDLKGREKDKLVFREIEVEVLRADPTYYFDGGKSFQQIHVEDEQGNKEWFGLWYAEYQDKYKVGDHLLLKYFTYHEDNRGVPEIILSFKGSIDLISSVVEEKPQPPPAPSLPAEDLLA